MAILISNMISVTILSPLAIPYLHKYAPLTAMFSDVCSKTGQSFLSIVLNSHRPKVTINLMYLFDVSRISLEIFPFFR